MGGGRKDTEGKSICLYIGDSIKSGQRRFSILITGTWKVNTSDQECSASQTIKTYFSLLYKKNNVIIELYILFLSHEIGLVKGFKINICEVLLWKGEFLRDTDILYYFIYYLR